MNLTALQQSPFLQSLGWAIANSLWQAAALWIAYHLVTGVYKNGSAKFKHNLSTILLSLAFIWFCITLFVKYFALENLSGNYEIQYYNPDDITAAATWNNLLNKGAAILPYLSVAYLLLLIFLSFRLINIYRFTRFIKFNGLQKPGVEWKLFTEKVARHMGITKKIRLWVSHHVDVPATIGFIKPVILIPLASINQLSADQLEAIILHELSHIKRNDYLINLFISIIETLLFFNPFIVLLAKVIKRERENCCDDFVIQYQYDRHAYASALLSLEQFRNADLRLAIGATSGKKQLLLRVKRIMEVNSNTNFNYGQKLAALLLITGVICSVAWLSPQNKEKKTQLVGKIQQRSFDKKISRNEKPETLFIKAEGPGAEIIAKVKTVPVKSPSKKVVTGAAGQLKELRDLNLKQIAEREYKMAYKLFQESKKQVIRRPQQRFSPYKTLMARGGTYTPFLEAKALTNWTNTELALHGFSAAELQKWQGEFDKLQFSFSFDSEEMKAAIKQAFNSKQQQTQPEIHTRQRLLLEEKMIEKLKVEHKNATDALKKLEAERVRGSVGANGRTVYRDSLVLLGGRLTPVYVTTSGGTTKVYVPMENTATTVQGQMDYAYVITDENKSKKMPAKVTCSTCPDVNPAPTAPSAGIRPGSIYRTVPVKETEIIRNAEPGKTANSKQGTSQKENIRIEYKNGVMVLNGKKVEMPDTHELYALYSVKGKKVVSKAKNLVEHVDD